MSRLDGVLCRRGGLETLQPGNELWWPPALTLLLASLLEQTGSVLPRRGPPLRARPSDARSRACQSLGMVEGSGLCNLNRRCLGWAWGLGRDRGVPVTLCKFTTSHCPVQYTEHTPCVACWRPTRASRGEACGGASLTTVSPTVLSLRSQVLPRGAAESAGLAGCRARLCARGRVGSGDLACRSLCRALLVRVAHACDCRRAACRHAGCRERAEQRRPERQGSAGASRRAVAGAGGRSGAGPRVTSAEWPRAGASLRPAPL